MKSKSNSDRALREHLLYLLKGGGAHATFDQAIADFPVSLRGKKPGGQPHTAWRILEHLIGSVGHPRIQPQPQARISGLAERVLAKK